MLCEVVLDDSNYDSCTAPERCQSYALMHVLQQSGCRGFSLASDLENLFF